MRNILFSFFVLATVLIPRFLNLTLSPPLIVDEPANIRDIEKILAGTHTGFADFEWGYDKAILVQYPTVFLIKIGIRDRLFALRLTSVIMSIIAVIGFYFIVQHYTDRHIAFCTALMFASSYFFLQFSRVGWTNMLMITLGLWFLHGCLKFGSSPTLIRAIFMGILGGLLLYTYRAGELYIVAGYILCAVQMGKHLLKKNALVLIGFSIVIMAVVSFPWIMQIQTNWDKFTLRQRTVSIANTNRPYHEKDHTFDIYVYQILTTIRSWVFMIPTQSGGTEGSRYLPLSYPPIHPVLIPLYLFGIVLMGMSPIIMAPWLCIYAVGIVGGQILTVDPPNGARALIVLPVIYLAIALSTQTISRKFPHFFTLRNMYGMAFVLSATDIATYFYWMSWIVIQ